MSRRPPALTLLATLCLVSLAFGTPLLAPSTRAYGEHIFQASPVVGPGDPYYSVYAGTTLAESISVRQDYLLANVTLRVRNDGGRMNALGVSIRPDDPVRHVPLMSTQLASSSWVTPDGQSVPVNWNFAFYPSPLLQAGSVYWIVAQNSALLGPPTDGYEWHESNADTYPNGSAFALDTASGVWTGLPYDLYFVTYGREWTSNLSLAVTADRVEAQPAEDVTFTVDFNNTGTQAAPGAWINTTLPSGLSVQSVSFPGIQPVSPAAFPNLTFKNVTNGPHAFIVSAEVEIGLTPGTVIHVRVSLDFQNATGAMTRGRQASIALTVGLVTKQLYLGDTSVPTKLLTTVAPSSAAGTTAILNRGAVTPLQFLLAPPLAESFAARSISGSLWVSANNTPPQSYRVNLSLLDDGTPIASQEPAFTLDTAGYHVVNFSFGGFGHTFAYGHHMGLSLRNLGGPGGSTDDLLLRYNGTADPSRLNLVTSTYVAVDELALENPKSNATVWSPLDPIAILANVSDPFGASRIDGAWINITSPSGSRVAAGAMAVLMTDGSSLPAWRRFNYTLAPPLATGRYRIDVTAVEDNGVVDVARSYAAVATPVFALVDVTSLGRAQAGGSFAYYLHYNNTGNGAAESVTINETLPGEVAYAGSNVPYNSVSGNRYTWVLSNVSVGSHMLEVDVTVLGSSVVPAWIRDNATLAYTDGSGHPGKPLIAYAPVFLNGPVLTMSLSGAPASGIHANEAVVYTLHLLNTGADSGTVWMNDTLPAGFVYLSDNAGPLGASLTQDGSRLLYEFPSILAGSDWTVEINVRTAPSLLLNVTYANVLATNYTSVNGYLMPAERTVCSLLAVNPWFSLVAVTFLSPRSSPGGDAPMVVSLHNDGNEAASWAWVNLTLDARLTVVNATHPFTSQAGITLFVLQNVTIGWTQIYLNLTVSSATADASELLAGGTLEGRNAIGQRLPRLTLNPDAEFISAASFRLIANPIEPTPEAGVPFPLSIGTWNIGSGDAANAWLNVTIPGVLEFQNDTADVEPSAVGPLYSWHWAPPSHTLLAGSLNAFTLTLRARAATPNGTSANVTLRVEYQDADLLSRAGVNLTVHVVILAPTLQLTVEASQTSVASGGTFNYTVRVANRGLSVAHWVWLHDVLDSNLQLISYTSSAPAAGSGTLNWTYTDLAPGAIETITLTVRTLEGLAPQTYIANSVEATYTNSVGVSLGSVRAAPVTVRIAQDLTAIVWSLGVAAIAGAALFVFFTRRPHVEIEEAFLVYRDGVLISHLSRTLMREKDEDVLSGMLTAVQEFVREAFQYGERRELHQLDFGDYRILIERGKYVYLAIVYSGKESLALRKRIRSVIELVEKQFGEVLEKWEGDMEEVMGARDLIRETLLGSGNHNLGERGAVRNE